MARIIIHHLLRYAERHIVDAQQDGNRWHRKLQGQMPRRMETVMETISVIGITSNPSFVALVRRRGRFVACLTAATLIPYYSFILVAGFNPQLLAMKISSGSTVNIGWLVGVVLIVGTWLLTGLYVRRANREFDELAAEILGGGAK